jgi:hypothetical protein
MQAKRDLPQLSDRLPLGSSGLEVSPICMLVAHVSSKLGELHPRQ